MEQKVQIIFLKKNRFKQHLIYVVNDAVIIETTKNNLIIFKNKTKYFLIAYVLNYKKNGYEIIGKKAITFKIKDSNNGIILNRPFLFNCISIGKILTGKKGIFFSCESFFNSIKE